MTQASSLSRGDMPFQIEGASEHPLVSEEGKCYRIFLYKPDLPAPESGYPLMVLVNANSYFGSMVEAVKLQTRKPHGYDPAVVVGIGYYPYDLPDAPRRFYDCTVLVLPEELPPRTDDHTWPASGGADALLTFIELTLQPWIKRTCVIDENRQALIGHSIGGLFTLHGWLRRPHLFSAFAACSPSLWWNNRYVLREVEAGLAMPTNHLLLAVGGREDERETTALYTAISDVKQDTAGKISYVIFPEEGHMSVIPVFISRVLRFFLHEDRPGHAHI